MSQGRSHIAAKITWDTTFDDKTLSQELLSALSHWSNFALQRHLSTTFEALCPEDETWYVPKLEIDLGPLGYASLASDLNKTFPQKLQEALLLLIRAQIQKGVEEAQVISQEQNDLQWIENYLVKGYFPWNYSSKNELFSRIIDRSLRLVPQELLSLLYTIGRQSQVRKRLVWQLDTPTIKKVIKLIEPSNHIFISNFTHTLLLTQKETSKIKAPKAKFEKEIWLWIMDYLLAQRGTLFNKLAFAKSNLVSISKRFNMAYEDLLSWVAKSVSQAKIGHQGTKELLTVLDFLINERPHSVTKKRKTLSEGEERWSLFQQWVTGKSKDHAAVSDKNMNAILIRCSEEQPQQFSKLFASLKWDKLQWKVFLKQLTPQSFVRLMEVLTPRFKEDFEPILVQFEVMARQKSMPKQELWWIVVQYVVPVTASQKTIPGFIGFVSEKMAKTFSWETDFLLTEMVLKTIPRGKKRWVSLEAYPLFIDALVTREGNTPSFSFQATLESLLDQLFQLWQASVIENEGLEAVEVALIKGLPLYPKTSMQVLRDYPQREFIQQVISQLLNPKTTKCLLKEGAPGFFNALQRKFRYFEIKESGFTNKEQFASLRKRFFMLGLSVFLKSPKKGEADLLKDWLFLLKKQMLKERIPLSFFYAIDKGESLATNFEENTPLETKWHLSASLLLEKATTVEDFTSEFLDQVTHWDPKKFAVEMARMSRQQHSVILEKLIPSSAPVFEWYYAKVMGVFKRQKGKGAQPLEFIFQTFWESVKEALRYHPNALFLKAQLERVLKIKVASPLELKSPTEEKRKRAKVSTIKKITKASFIKIIQQEAEEERQELLIQWIYFTTNPSWLPSSLGKDHQELMLELLMDDPILLKNVLKNKIKTHREREKMMKVISISTLVSLILKVNPEMFQRLERFKGFLLCFPTEKVSGSLRERLQAIGYIKLLNAWLTGNWKSLSPQRLLHEIGWELQLRYGVSKNTFLEYLAINQSFLPKEFKQANREVVPKKSIQPPLPKENINIPKMNKVTPKLQHHGEPDKIAINNAGLVLLNSYFSILFNRLELVANGNFTSHENKLHAVQYLQFLVAGKTGFEEHFLVLNKLLCGIRLEEPVPLDYTISEGNKELIGSLIDAAIGHWPAIGNSSRDGFRGNWLMRDGLLQEEEAHWTLTVEKRPYDLLINKSPFSFSIIKFPWMPKPIKVQWPY
ncbi:MAG: contractile injection system tape measure protein [Flavobacteriaceae bacterium]